MNEAEKAYQYFVIAVPENEEQAKAYFWARKALQSTLTPQNDPLTIEQLREMDGEPVYIISEFYHISEWNIPNGIVEIVITYDVPCAGMKEVIPSIKFIDGKELAVEKYGSSWVAYRRPPEGEEDT